MRYERYVTLKDVQKVRSARPQRVKGRGGPTALRVDRSPVKWNLANGKASPVLPTSDGLFLNVEPLSEASTLLAGFFNIRHSTEASEPKM